MAELFHGPTLAFKDLPMVCVGPLLSYFLKKRGKRATVLVGTYNILYIDTSGYRPFFKHP